MRTILIGLAVAAVASGVSAIIPPYAGFLTAQLAVIVIAVASLNLLGNVAGMLSLASAAFMGVGGYGVLIFLTIYGLPLIVSVPLTLMMGFVFGWVMGLVAVRLSGISLAIVTFGFVQVFQVFIKQGGAFSGDGYGLILPPMEILGFGPLTPRIISLTCVFIAAMVLVFTLALTRSRIGRAWFAIKENPVAAEMQGVNLLSMRAKAFATSGAMASLAGILQAFLLGITNPSLYTIDTSISHLSMMVVGGSSGSVVGSVLGPVVLYFLPEFFHLGSYRDILYGGALLLTLALAPQGLAGAWEYLGRYLVPTSRNRTRH